MLNVSPSIPISSTINMFSCILQFQVAHIHISATFNNGQIPSAYLKMNGTFFAVVVVVGLNSLQIIVLVYLFNL